MTRKKIIGTETEYGIARFGASQYDPISTSILLVNSYQPTKLIKVCWDYDQESPLKDARGFELKERVERPSREDNLVLNKILPNGARLYVDHAHPEFSTPECSNVRDAVVYEKAGEQILELSRARAAALLAPGERLVIYKNNSDKKGNSYGCHENYLMSRKTPFDKIAREVMPFLVTRQVFTGAGKVGAERHIPTPHFQISQRADFFETDVGLDTMAKRPIINTRDEPHADKDKYRRLHVIVGDSNMSEYTIYLKLGVTSLVLQMIEDNFVHEDLTLKSPVKAIRQVSHDISCKKKIDLTRGRRYSAVEVQKAYLEMATEYCGRVGSDPAAADILDKWEYVLRALETDPMQLHREIDWVIKYALIRTYIENRGLPWSHPKASMLDLQYHDTRPEKGLYHLLVRQGKVARLLSDEEIRHAIQHPPEDTRAYFRGECQRRFGERVFGVNWDSISFMLPDGEVKRLSMAEPFKGSAENVGELLQESGSVEELLDRLTT